MLRQEVYALDATGTRPNRRHPYTVIEQNFTLERAAAAAAAIAMRSSSPIPARLISNHYERNPADPRISHALTLEVDASATSSSRSPSRYGRRRDGRPGADGDDKAKQTQLLDHLHRERLHRHRRPLRLQPTLPRTAAQRGANLRTDRLRCQRRAPADRFSFEEWSTQLRPARVGSRRFRTSRRGDHQEADSASSSMSARSIARTTSSPSLPLGKVESLALPGETYKLALTPACSLSVYAARGQRRAAADDGRVRAAKERAAIQGGYVDLDGNWWIPSGRYFFDARDRAIRPHRRRELAPRRQHFFLPRSCRRCLRHETPDRCTTARPAGDRDHDPVGNRVAAATTTACSSRGGHRSEPQPLGVGVRRARHGRRHRGDGQADGQPSGDLLEGFDADPTLGQVDASSSIRRSSGRPRHPCWATPRPASCTTSIASVAPGRPPATTPRDGSRCSPPRWRARPTSATSRRRAGPRSRSASPSRTASVARSRRRSRPSRAR